MNQRATFRERHWKVLMSSVAQCRVVPVIGQELLVARDGETEVPFYDLVARRVAQRFDLADADGMKLDEILEQIVRPEDHQRLVRSYREWMSVRDKK